MGIIYLWTNKNTGKHYVGQTIHPDQRKRNHIHEAFVRGSDYYFHRSLRKHGLEAFKYEILEEGIERDLLNERENYYINKFNSIWPNGYNQCEANSLSLESIDKMKETKRNQWNSMTVEERNAWREDRKSFTMKGKKQSEKQKQIVAEANQKEWIITYPDGRQETISNLQQFCRDQGLGTNGQSNLTRGSYKGYKAVKVS
jgi:group I intron endonuclease